MGEKFQLVTIVHDPTTQWCLMAVGFVCLIAGLAVQWKSQRISESFTKSRVCIYLLLALGLRGYISHYQTASATGCALFLVWGVCAGMCLNFLVAHWKYRAMAPVLFTLCSLILLRGFWRSDATPILYHGVSRRSGLWNNPNTLGIFMATALATILPYLGATLRLIITANRSHQPLALWRILKLLICTTAAVGLGVCLIQSYSRAAWFALGAASLYFALCWPRIRTEQARSTNNAFILSLFVLLILDVAVVTVAHGQNLKPTILRRALSVLDVKDFSWRNRVAAYEGSLQMMADKPFFGFGWNRSQTIYDQYYLRPSAQGVGAVRLNDYLTLSTELGIGAGTCLFAYLLFSLRKGSLFQRLATNERLWACRSGAIVLATTFWFDGGLLNFSTGALFWFLMEAGAEPAVGTPLPDCDRQISS